MRASAAAVVWSLVLAAFATPAVARDANRTVHPIVFAHGMGGFDDILGYDYWGNDYGVYVLDPCDGFLETSCNPDISTSQRSFVASVTPFNTSEQRGYELYQDVLGYMASSGATGVNLIGHSQGGLDLRKAAKLLQQHKGTTVVKYGISLASPHRGSPIAKYVLDVGPGVVSVLDALAQYYGSVVYGPGNDGVAALKQLVFDDYDAGDGVTTGAKRFNQLWPRDPATILRARSMLATQQGVLSLNPALYLIQQAFTDIDGDGWAATDADNDGAMGVGDGSRYDTDDDGLVGVNSTQMGYRLEHVECWPCLDSVYERTSTGFCGDLNAPDATMMTSHAYAIPQDHVDIIGIGPDTFDEMEFYAALTDYVADGGY